MKRIILVLIIVLALGSCMTPRHAYVRTYVGDLSKYLKEGVAVYPVAPSETGYKEYIPVAEIYVEAGYGLDENEKIFDPTYEYMIEQLVSEAKKRGANCLFNVKINVGHDSEEEYSLRCTASGFAVKLKNYPQE